MDGQVTDGRQAHCNIPQTFLSGDKKPLTEYGTQPYGQPWGSTISVQI